MSSSIQPTRRASQHALVKKGKNKASPPPQHQVLIFGSRHRPRRRMVRAAAQGGLLCTRTLTRSDNAPMPTRRSITYWRNSPRKRPAKGLPLHAISSICNVHRKFTFRYRPFAQVCRPDSFHSEDELKFYIKYHATTIWTTYCVHSHGDGLLEASRTEAVRTAEDFSTCEHFATPHPARAGRLARCWQSVYQIQFALHCRTVVLEKPSRIFRTIKNPLATFFQMRSLSDRKSTASCSMNLHELVHAIAGDKCLQLMVITLQMTADRFFSGIAHQHRLDLCHGIPISL